MAKEQIQNEREYQTKVITYAKGGGTLNAYMCAQGRCGKDRKIGSFPDENLVILFAS